MVSCCAVIYSTYHLAKVPSVVHLTYSKISPELMQRYLKCKFLLMNVLDLRSTTCFHSRSSQTPIYHKARSLNFYNVWLLTTYTFKYDFDSRKKEYFRVTVCHASASSAQYMGNIFLIIWVNTNVCAGCYWKRCRICFNTVLMCCIVTCFGSRWGMSQDLEKGTVLCVCLRQRPHLSLNGSPELPTGLQARQSRLSNRD